jgi:hypothetical protein
MTGGGGETDRHAITFLKKDRFEGVIRLYSPLSLTAPHLSEMKNRVTQIVRERVFQINQDCLREEWKKKAFTYSLIALSGALCGVASMYIFGNR